MHPLDHQLAIEGDTKQGWTEFCVVGPEGKPFRYFLAWCRGVQVSAKRELKYHDEKDWVALKAQAWDTLDKACGVWLPEDEKEPLVLCPCGTTYGCVYPHCAPEERRVEGLPG